MSKTIVRREYINNTSLPGSLHPVLLRIYCARNIRHPDELDYSLRHMLPYDQLQGIDSAVELLAEAVEQDKHLMVVADFDADGATGCALAIRGLRAMGAKSVDYLVPSRFDFGYGLSPELVEVAAGHAPDLIITVDNGISSIEGVRRAREKGIDVLITDHHLPGHVLPDAVAIVNPNMAEDGFPSKSLAGVGVMFYLLAALRSHFRETGWFVSENIEEPNLADFLDLVALGTVADVVPLDHNNRILVEQGLKRIRSGRCTAGIFAMLQVAKKSHRKITAADLGFTLGPRLNAAGRLDDMSLGIECLLCDEQVKVLEIARKLDELNRERREIQQEMQTVAGDEIQKLGTVRKLPSALCLYNNDWHQGVVGILASRLKEKFHRPVIAFAKESDEMLKGSGRSIPGVHIRDVLDEVAGKHPGLIPKFGGHAMAAGLSLAEKDIDEFTEAFRRAVEKQLSEELLKNKLLTDGELQDDQIDLGLAEAIRLGGPWGQGFPEPVFDGVFKVHERRILSDQHRRLLVSTPAGNINYDAIAFYTLDDEWPEKVEQVQMAYRLDINEFQGRRKLQFIVEHIEPLR